jgi:hypothetical protein
MKHELSDTKKELLKVYARAIAHMRQEFRARRFGLVLGAGATRDMGFPEWKQLVEQIAAHSEVQATDLLTNSLSNTSKSQVIFQHYSRKYREKLITKDSAQALIEAKVRAGWLNVVRSVLYSKVPKSNGERIKLDQYLHSFKEVIEKSPLTINYNFDDVIEVMLDEKLPDPGGLLDGLAPRRGYRTSWGSAIHLQAGEFPIIHHPNGYLPQDEGRRGSDQLVFLDDSFADQLIDSMVGHSSEMLAHLCRSTCLFIGLSLDDGNLKHLLRQVVSIRPGHYHYYVHFCEDDAKPSAKHQKAIAEANFNVYNLITLFLTRSELNALGSLIGGSDSVFEMALRESGVFGPVGQREMRWIYMITGPVGAGKSTAISNLAALGTFDEWLSTMPPKMHEDPTILTDAEETKIDEWVSDQLYKKNAQMNNVRPGIYVADRAPLDFLAFAKKQGEWPIKAKRVLDHFDNKNSRFVRAQIILLTGDPRVMSIRAAGKNKTHSDAFLEKHQGDLKRVYDNGELGITVIETNDKSVRRVIQDIARVIFMGDYEEFCIHSRLEQIAKLTSQETRHE